MPGVKPISPLTTKPTPAVVITGASSGIGFACTRDLAARGIVVFAGVRCDKDASSLRSLIGENVHPIKLDVTDANSVSAAVASINGQLENMRLIGLVNNAGVAIAGPLELLSIDSVRSLFEVNVVGLLAVTQKMLPLLRRDLGRIVTIGSISGSVPLPFAGAYGASKAAVAALDEVLSYELAQFGIGVSRIDAGRVRTGIWSKARQTLGKCASQPGCVDGDPHNLWKVSCSKLDKKLASEHGLDPQIVADAVWHALTSRRSKRRYLVGADARKLSRLELLPRPVREWFIHKYYGQINFEAGVPGATQDGERP